MPVCTCTRRTKPTKWVLPIGACEWLIYPEPLFAHVRGQYPGMSQVANLMLVKVQQKNDWSHIPVTQVPEGHKKEICVRRKDACIRGLPCATEPVANAMLRTSNRFFQNSAYCSHFLSTISLSMGRESCFCRSSYIQGQGSLEYLKESWSRVNPSPNKTPQIRLKVRFGQKNNYRTYQRGGNTVNKKKPKYHLIGGNGVPIVWPYVTYPGVYPVQMQ